MDKYEVLGQVGEGSFGQVYKARKRSDGEIVAFKVIRKAILANLSVEQRGRSLKELKSLRQECEIQRRLHHPNIVRMLDSFETENQIIVVIEYVDKELYEILGKAGRLPEERARVIACDLVSALYYLHSNRVLHRDLKPQNVLLEANGVAKLCDFGFARSMSIGTHVLTSIKGTPLYMAPELIEVCPYDHNADLWSLGCIVYELIVGTPPFQATSILHLVRLIRFEAIKWPDFISPICKSFLQGLLQKDASQRLTWPELLDHPFVKGRILTIGESASTPFTTPLSASQALAKQQQLQSLALRSASRSKILERAVEKIHEQERKLREQRHRTCVSQPRYPISHGYCRVVGVQDYQALRRSEPSGTDTSVSVDVLLGNLSLRASLRSDLLAAEHALCNTECPINEIICPPVSDDAFDNDFRAISRDSVDAQRARRVIDGQNDGAATGPMSTEKIMEIHGKNDDADCTTGKSRLSHDYEQEFGNDDEKFSNETRLRDWEPSLVERHIENEEWIAFLQRSMEEVMDGEIDSLLQKNCVSVFVSPLRNSAAGCRVVEYVACLLSLPFVVTPSYDIMSKIELVYLDVRVVPNLVYAMKLMMSDKIEKNIASSDQQSGRCNETRIAALLSDDELQALESSMLVLCRLVYARKQFLIQFCDAVHIVDGTKLFQQLLTLERRKSRVVGDLVAVLNNILITEPENSELVASIVIGAKNPPLDILELLKKLLTHRRSVIRSRTCILVRLLGRLCSGSLRRVWSEELKNLLESAARDDQELVRNAADDAVSELKQLTFYNQASAGE